MDCRAQHFNEATQDVNTSRNRFQKSYVTMVNAGHGPFNESKTVLDLNKGGYKPDCCDCMFKNN